MVVVRWNDVPTVEEWPAYEAAYKQVYDTMDHFVIVFDARNLGIPPLDLVRVKRQLMMDLKPYTCRQLLSAVVLVSHEILRELIVALVHASGQVSPFAVFSDVDETVAHTRRLIRIQKRLPIDDFAPSELILDKGGRIMTWGNAAPRVIYLIILALYLRCGRHFMRQARAAR